jgi:hypothetical protein
MVFGGGNTIYYSGSSDQGATFSAPVAVARTASLSLRNHRGPRIAFAGDAIVITASVGLAPAPAAGASGHGAHGAPEQLLSWRSTNGGKTWTAGARVTPTSGEGFHALASEGKNRLREVWMTPVDGRVKILGAHSDDAGLSWSEPKAIYQSPDKNVCECCHPSLALGADGEILVMFRNSIAGALDLYLARSKDAQRTVAEAGPLLNALHAETHRIRTAILNLPPEAHADPAHLGVGSQAPHREVVVVVLVEAA